MRTPESIAAAAAKRSATVQARKIHAAETEEANRIKWARRHVVPESIIESSARLGYWFRALCDEGVPPEYAANMLTAMLSRRDI